MKCKGRNGTVHLRGSFPPLPSLKEKKGKKESVTAEREDEEGLGLQFSRFSHTQVIMTDHYADQDDVNAYMRAVKDILVLGAQTQRYKNGRRSRSALPSSVIYIYSEDQTSLAWLRNVSSVRPRFTCKPSFGARWRGGNNHPDSVPIRLTGPARNGSWICGMFLGTIRVPVLTSTLATVLRRRRCKSGGRTDPFKQTLSTTSAVSRKSTSVTWLGFDRMGRSGSTLGLPLCLHDEKPSTKVRANPPNTFQTLPLCSHYDFLQGIPRLQLHNSILERRKLVIEAAGTVRMTRPPGWRFQPW